MLQRWWKQLAGNPWWHLILTWWQKPTALWPQPSVLFLVRHASASNSHNSLIAGVPTVPYALTKTHEMIHTLPCQTQGWHLPTLLPTTLPTASFKPPTLGPVQPAVFTLFKRWRDRRRTKSRKERKSERRACEVNVCRLQKNLLPRNSFPFSLLCHVWELTLWRSLCLKTKSFGIQKAPPLESVSQGSSATKNLLGAQCLAIPEAWRRSADEWLNVFNWQFRLLWSHGFMETPT